MFRYLFMLLGVLIVLPLVWAGAARAETFYVGEHCPDRFHLVDLGIETVLANGDIRRVAGGPILRIDPVVRNGTRNYDGGNLSQDRLIICEPLDAQMQYLDAEPVPVIHQASIQFNGLFRTTIHQRRNLRPYFDHDSLVHRPELSGDVFEMNSGPEYNCGVSLDREEREIYGGYHCLIRVPEVTDQVVRIRCLRYGSCAAEVPLLGGYLWITTIVPRDNPSFDKTQTLAEVVVVWQGFVRDALAEFNNALQPRDGRIKMRPLGD